MGCPGKGIEFDSTALDISEELLETGVVPGGSPVGGAGSLPITCADGSGESAVRVPGFLSQAASETAAATSARAMARDFTRFMG